MVPPSPSPGASTPGESGDDSAIDGAGSPDAETLRADLQDIKNAMGIAERYDGSPTLWLWYGALTAAAAVLSQAIHTARVSPWLHFIVWIGLLGILGPFVYPHVFADHRELWPADEHVPNLSLQFFAVYLAFVPLLVLLAPSLETGGYVEQASLGLGMILVLTGAAYVVWGASLRAYRIRLRDRVPFFVGGVWIAGLGTAIPYVGLLQEWGFAAFGGAYMIYALVTYAVLRGGAST